MKKKRKKKINKKNGPRREGVAQPPLGSPFERVVGIEFLFVLASEKQF
jgi:hypothetical protein